MNEARAISQSLRCFTFGLLSFVPVVGIACAIMAVATYMNTSSDGWNPAQRYAVRGVRLAALGLFIYGACIGTFVVIKVLES
jgi:hypothetical protein